MTKLKSACLVTAKASSGGASGEVLRGWKQIADYLGKSVRSVQRYERDFALPVRRPSDKSSGSVVAVKADLDQWVTSLPQRVAISPRRLPVDLEKSKEILKNKLTKMDTLYRNGRTLGSEVVESVAECASRFIVSETLKFEEAGFSEIERSRRYSNQGECTNSLAHHGVIRTKLDLKFQCQP